MHQIYAASAISRSRLILSLVAVVFPIVGCSSSDTTSLQPEPTITTTQEPSPLPADADEIVRPTPVGGAHTVEPAPKSSVDADGDGWLNWSEVTTGVHATFPSYEWPSNYTTDVETLLAWREATTNANGHDVSETNFEAGIEYSLPGEANVCAWTYNWLDAQTEGNQAKMEASMVHIRTQVGEAWSFSGIRADLEADFDRAELGDIAGMQRFSVIFCDRSLFSKSLEVQPNQPMLPLAERTTPLRT